MANFNADILLKVNSTAAERQIKKVDRNLQKIEETTKDILSVDKQIVRERRALTRVSAEQATRAKKRITDLRLQRTELALQKRELQQISRLEQQRVKNSRAGGAGLGKAAGAGAAFATVPGQDFLQAGAAGALIAGPKGAIVAAAVAGTLKAANALGELGKESSITAAEVGKLETALRGVAGSNFDKSLQLAREVSEDFNVPLNEAIGNITKITAAADSVGLSFKDIDTVIRGLSASNKALGGDQEKLNGTLNAAIQILSKGKVQAEELRGQIGDRLPGAFGRFAESLKISTAELDKRLKDGKVTVADFVTFTQGELDKFGENAKVIADGPDEAGARLKQSLTNLKLALGPLTKSIGATFQDLGTEIVKGLTKGAEAIQDLQRGALQGQLKIEQGLKTNIEKRLAEVAPTDQSGPQVRALERRLEASNERIRELQRLLQPLLAQDGFIGPPAPTVPKTKTEQYKQKPDPDAVKRAADAEKRLRAAEQAVFTQRELNRLAADLARAELAGNDALAARLQGIRDELNIRNRLFGQLENEADARVRAQLETKALLDIDNVRIGVGQKLAQIEKDRTSQLKDQRNLLLQIAGFERTIAGASRIGGDPTQGLRDQLRSLQNERKFGGDADLAAQVEDLVLNKGVPFNEAFDLAEQVKAQRELNAETERYNQLIQSVGNTIETGIVDAIGLAVTETDRLGEAMKSLASDILQAIGKALILNAVTGAVSALGGKDGVGLFSILSGNFGKVPRFADGGVLPSTGPAIVGEEGPELALSSGGRTTIVPMSDAMARYSPSNGGGRAAGADGSSISGGAAGGQSGPIHIETTVINSVEYLTVDQGVALAREAEERGAKRGAAGGFTKSMNSLKNSRSQRSRLGLR
ncbi:tape measure domain protein [Synechococcus sp. MEDNS5]|uniref:tape measure protein n=1 Tax=Synechococcus sp. MEDNS5 TaxID=1442554 RepID=UPI0016491EE4|nr:tape measure protein [Synechococcus sp. MEDNS5]QNJ06274.1 tape measure domain protein [Synechococcus sp. MEDNS5]